MLESSVTFPCRIHPTPQVHCGVQTSTATYVFGRLGRTLDSILGLHDSDSSLGHTEIREILSEVLGHVAPRSMRRLHLTSE